MKGKDLRIIGNPNQLPSGAVTQEAPLTKPRKCAVIPHRTEDPEGFIETRNECDCGQSVIVSIAAVREMATLIGLPTKDDYEALKDENAAKDDEIAALEMALDALYDSKQGVVA